MLRQMALIEIDGSYGEGGGQMVRTACCFGAVPQKPCRIYNIRQARRVPGLRPEHLACVRALAQLCDPRLEADRVDSRELIFAPRRIAAHDLTVQIETAGSITLILQALLPAIVAGGAPITIEFDGGGTDTARAPTLDYLRHVFLWFLHRMGTDITIDLLRRGYYPRGGAEMRAKVDTAHKPERLELSQRGFLKQVALFSQAAKVLKPRRVAERQIEGALAIFDSLQVPTRSEVEYDPSLSAGSSLRIVAEFANTVIASDALAARGKEDVGKEAAEQFVQEFGSSSCLDRHMADQILPYLALLQHRGSVKVSEVTSHCRSNMWVIEMFLVGRFEVDGNVIVWNAG